MARVQKYGFTRRMFTRPARKTLVLNTICTVCCTQTVYYTGLLCVKYGMHAYAGRACICRMHAPSMLIPPTQSSSHARQRYQFTRRMFTRPVRKTLVFNTICTVCSTKTVYYISVLCVKYGMHAYACPACICRMHAPSMLIPPTQDQWSGGPFRRILGG